MSEANKGGGGAYTLIPYEVSYGVSTVIVFWVSFLSVAEALVVPDYGLVVDGAIYPVFNSFAVRVLAFGYILINCFAWVIRSQEL